MATAITFMTTGGLVMSFEVDHRRETFQLFRRLRRDCRLARGPGQRRRFNKGTWRLATVLVLALLGVSSGCGQPLALAQPLSAATVGAGVVGVDAGSALSAAANPALLGLRQHSFQLSLTPIVGSLKNNAFTFEDIRKLSESDWEPEDEQWFLQQIPDKDGAWRLGADGAAGARLAVGPVSVGGEAVLAVDAQLDKGILEFLLDEEPVIDKQYSIARTGGSVMGYGELGGSLTMPVAPLARMLGVKAVHAGLGYKMLYGIGFAEVTADGEGFKVEEDPLTGAPKVEDAVDARVKIVSGEKGRGSAFDVGVAVEINDNLFVDLAVVNIGEIRWEDAHRRIYKAHIKGGDLSTDPEAEMKEIDSEPLKDYAIDAPQTVRAGIGGKVGGAIRWAAEYSHQVKGPGKGTSTFGAGVELAYLKVLPLRLGMRSTSGSSPVYSAGFGVNLGLVTIDVGTPDLGAFLGGKSTEWAVAFSTGLRF